MLCMGGRCSDRFLHLCRRRHQPKHPSLFAALSMLCFGRQSSFEGGIFSTFVEDSRVEHCLDIGDAARPSIDKQSRDTA